MNIQNLFSNSRFTRQQLMLIATALLLIIIIAAVVWMRRDADRAALVRAAENLLAAESFHTTTELVINLPQRYRNQDRPFTLVTVRVEGDVVQAEDSTPELAGTLLLEAKGRGNIFFADGDVRVLRDEVLFRLDNLPVFLNPTGSLVNRWTRVESGLLQTRNADEVKQVLTDVVSGLQKADTETVDGVVLTRFTGTVSPEQAEQLYQTLRRRASGNLGLHQVARLLNANNVESLDVWVDGSDKEIRKISAHFVRPLEGEERFDFARLTMEFSDYGQEVTIDRPETQLRVQPEVFGRIFGAGDIGDIELQPE